MSDSHGGRKSSQSGGRRDSTEGKRGSISDSDHDESSPLISGGTAQRRGSKVTRKRANGASPSAGGSRKKITVDNFDFSFETGPDKILEANSLRTWKANEPVKLQLSSEGPNAIKPMSIMTVFKQTVRDFPNHIALAHQTAIGETWHHITYTEYFDLVCRAAKSFIALGLQPSHGVGIIGFNSVEWFVSDLACIFAGGLATGIYTTNSPEACRYVAASARCNVLVVENDHQLQKILKVRSSLTDLKAVVQYKGEIMGDYDNVYTWEEFLSLSDEVEDSTLAARFADQAPNKCCTLIYTSGTTGDPKGVMLSHDNYVWTARAAGLQGRLVKGAECLVSYLPLSHVAAQILDIYIPLMYAGSVYFAQPDALRGSLGETLKSARPTAFLGVPRVWEKMQEKMIATARANSWVKIWIAKWAKSIGLRGNMALMNGGQVPYGWTLANLLVFRKVRAALGFQRCKFCLTAAAPIMRETLDFFMSLDLPLMEIYGMSETTGPHTISFPWRYRTVSVGEELFGSITRFNNPSNGSDGEVCMRGRNMFMGYLNMKEKTMEALTQDGWVMSGDVGHRDDSGFIFITGRIKELLITAGGENVSPVQIEDVVKECLPCVSNAMLVGDRRKFLAILLTLKTKPDPATSEPTDVLSESALHWFNSKGITSVKTVTQIIEEPSPDVLSIIQAGIDQTNDRAESRAKRIQKWTILPGDFTISGGELGPTLKVRRAIVAEKYKSTIDRMYEESDDQ